MSHDSSPAAAQGPLTGSSKECGTVPRHECNTYNLLSCWMASNLG